MSKREHDLPMADKLSEWASQRESDYLTDWLSTTIIVSRCVTLRYCSVLLETPEEPVIDPCTLSYWSTIKFVFKILYLIYCLSTLAGKEGGFLLHLGNMKIFYGYQNFIKYS